MTLDDILQDIYTLPQRHSDISTATLVLARRDRLTSSTIASPRRG
jgi:hypothetical protein